MIVFQSLACALIGPSFGYRTIMVGTRCCASKLMLCCPRLKNSDHSVYSVKKNPIATPPHPIATVALGCETLHWVAPAPKRHPQAGLTASHTREFQGHSRRQTKIKPRQTKKTDARKGCIGLRTQSAPSFVVAHAALCLSITEK
jgi:hypothetical protein